jgi:hypothetical protein
MPDLDHHEEAPWVKPPHRPTDPAMLGEPRYERIQDDFYPTPPEYVDCLAHYLNVAGMKVWEPACGEGHISKRLIQLGAYVISTDLIDRGYGKAPLDFLKCPRVPPALTKGGGRIGIITNPPYGELADRFLAAALELTAPVDGIVAMFMRNEWDCGDKRTAPFFEGNPAFAMKIVVTKRPRWIAGSTGSPRHNYAWYVWDHRQAGAPATIHYIHPKNARPIVQENVTCH